MPARDLIREIVILSAAKDPVPKYYADKILTPMSIGVRMTGFVGELVIMLIWTPMILNVK